MFRYNKNILQKYSDYLKMSEQRHPSTPPKDQIEKLIKIYQSGQVSKTEKISRKLLKKFPKSIITINILGAALVGQKKFKNALHAYNQIIQLDPNHTEAFFNQGVVYQKIKQHQNAVDSYSQAIKLQPDYAEAFNNRGHALQELGNLDQAIDNYNQAILLKPDYAEAFYNTGVVFQTLKRFQDSINSYDRAIKLNPNYPKAFNNRGHALQELGHLDQAIDNYKQAILLKPDYFEAHYNQGTALEDLGKIDKAINSYTKAIKTKNGDIEALWNLSLLLIMTGDLKNGWEKYEFGKLTEKQDRKVAHTPFPSWKGGDLSGKIILITAEQGIGDEIMFSSCIPDIIKQNPKRIIVECDSRISALLENSFYPIQTIKRKNRSQADWKKDVDIIDYQISIGSLPKFFRQNIDQFPQNKSFLLPNQVLEKKWKHRYTLLGEGLKIGISWKGGDNDQQRSIRLQDWKEILKFKVHFINLQYGDCVQEIEQLKIEQGVHIHSWDDADPLIDLDNFAAQISELDLVISVDNSTVHFAGAVGTPVWVLLPLLSNYRWMQDRDDSPWYPTMKLFRQTHRNHWDNVFHDIKKELKNKINSI